MNCAVLQARTRYGPSEIAQQENGHTTFNPTARNFPSIRLREIKYISPKCKKKKRKRKKKIKIQTIKFNNNKKKSQLVSIDAPFTGAADADAPTGGYRRLDNKMVALYLAETHIIKLISIELRINS